MNSISFRYRGRFGHFLKAEASASAPSYPVPSRTVLLGLIGAILGLNKDQPQELLKTANLAVRGAIPSTHWHSANLRKDPPAALSLRIEKADKGSCGRQRNTIITQEWLINPDYQVWAALPNPYHQELVRRLKFREWYFVPCLGLSEMMADLVFLSESFALPLDPGLHEISSIIRRDAGKIDLNASHEKELAILMLRMPREVSPVRAFKHEAYYIERQARLVPVHTDKAWLIGNEKVIFL
jgi:CRISPR-associated protein Cas5h